ncbi:MAG: EamA family transporter [Gemmatimonadaceae bacterium]
MKATRSGLIAGFASLYFFWGSTYLFIKFAVETLPPIGMAGVRFTIAGALLYLWTRGRGAERPTALQWRSSLIVGAFLMGSNACIAYAERRVPSGVTSLMVAITPVWMVTFDWLLKTGQRPRLGVVAGLIAGLVGVAILLGPGQMGGGAPVDPLGAAVILGGTVTWAFGSIYSRHVPRPASSLLGSAMHMLCGGMVLLVVSLLTGQFDGFTLAQVSGRSWLGFVYLIIFGSLVGFSSFVYLLRTTTAARVATYAYVNPVVAVLLGWLFAGEEIGIRVAVAAAVIIGAVAVITTFGGATKSKERGERRVESPATTAMVEEVP